MRVSASTILAFMLALLSGCGQRKRGSSCIANLKQIDGAKMIWALEEKKTAADTPTDSDLFGATKYIKHKPICPRGGIYTLGRVEEPPRCSVREHDEHWQNILEQGKVYVFSESCVPLAGVTVQVVGATGQFSLVNTDANGLAHINAYQGKEIIVSKSGYATNAFILPPLWPFRIVLVDQTH